MKPTSNRLRKKIRIRKKVRGTADRPRMTIYKSLRSLYVQLIDDEAGRTFCSALSRGDKTMKGAEQLGVDIANKAKKKSIKKIVFDRNGYRYHGVVRLVAENARKNGLEF